MPGSRLRGTDGRTGSPPTDRVVAIVELLAGQHSEPSSVASIASRLELSRSTVTAILVALERAGWVLRRPDRCYVLGLGLIGVADGLRGSLPFANRFDDALGELAHRAGCGATLAFVASNEMTFVSVVPGPGTMPAGVGVGLRLPLIPPVGAAVIAQRDSHTQRGWLESSRAVSHATLVNVLAQVRGTGVAVFRLGNCDPEILDVLTDVAGLLAEHPRRDPLRQRVFDLLIGLSGHPYTADELSTDECLSVSHLAAPVFDADGFATFELQLGPLRASVSPAEREWYVHEISATATRLSAH